MGNPKALFETTGKSWVDFGRRTTISRTKTRVPGAELVAEPNKGSFLCCCFALLPLAR